MKRILALGLAFGLCGVLAAAPSKAETQKEKLRELQEFIGAWKGTASTKAKPGPRDKFWEEVVNWSWRFKGGDCWLTVDFKGGKFLKDAELRWLADRKKYQLSGAAPEGKEKLVFLGDFKDDKLVMERTDPKTKEIQRLRMNTAAEGVRLIYYVDRRIPTGTIWRLEYQMASTKQGENLAKKEKGPECVVSGGLGTMTVTHNGETFYVCCSGCRDEFNANPKKYVDEFKAKKK